MKKNYIQVKQEEILASFGLQISSFFLFSIGSTCPELNCVSCENYHMKSPWADGSVWRDMIISLLTCKRQKSRQQKALSICVTGLSMLDIWEKRFQWNVLTLLFIFPKDMVSSLKHQFESLVSWFFYLSEYVSCHFEKLFV